MRSTFSPIVSAAAAPPALAGTADAHRALFVAVVFVADPADGLPPSQRSRSYSLMAELVAVVASCVAEVPPRRLHGNAASSNTSARVGVGVGEIIGVDYRHHPLSVCKVAVLPLKVGLAGSLVLWWKAPYDDVLVLAVRRVLLENDGNEAAAVLVLFCRESQRGLHPNASLPFPFLGM